MSARYAKSSWHVVVGMFAIGVVILCGVVLFGRQLSEPSSLGGSTSGSAVASSSANPEQVLERLAARNAAIVKRLRRQTPKRALDAGEARASENADASHGSVRGHTQETIKGFQTIAWVAHEERRMFNRTALQEKEYERVVNDPAALALARDVATDVAAAQEIYGDEQALMRTYAVRSLSYAAAHGKPEVVENAVDVIGRKLNVSEKWEKGVQHDYVELAASYVRHLGRQALLADPESVWQRIHLTERTSVEVGRALYDSGVLGDLATDDRQRLSASYDRYIEGLQP